VSSGQDIKARDALLALAPVLNGLSTQLCVFDSAMTVVAANESFCAFADSVLANSAHTPAAKAGDTSGAAWAIVQMAAGEGAAAVRAGVESVRRGELACFEHEYAVRIAGKLKFFTLKLQSSELDGERVVLLEQHDATAQRLLARRLMRAERAEGAELLASSVAHDLNNLLLVINGYTDLVMRSAGDANASDREEISRAVKSASGLTQQLLSMRPGAVRNSTVNANQVLKDLSRLLIKLAGDDITLELQLDEQVGRVQCEAPLIQQILGNLVSNARDAMSNGGRIVVSTHNLIVGEGSAPTPQNIPSGPSGPIGPIGPIGHWVVLRVHDTGSGMEELTLKRAFEPFFSTKSDDEAAGLGLWIVDEIVRRAQGHVRVTSTVGQGTTVDVYLPALEASHGQLFATSLSPSARRATLLVVEDNTAVRELLQRMLRGAGYYVLVAAGPGEARAISESTTQPIHLLLTDVVMSDMSGPLLARELQRSRPELAVVLMSGYSGATCAQREEWLPSAVFLEKPFTAAHVLRTVQEALDAAQRPSR
jgi:two-component system cell cycle sensor histidine kinase/response regulator CckA